MEQRKTLLNFIIIGFLFSQTVPMKMVYQLDGFCSTSPAKQENHLCSCERSEVTNFSFV